MIAQAGKANLTEINEVPTVKLQTGLKFPTSLPSRRQLRAREDARSTLLLGKTECWLHLALKVYCSFNTKRWVVVWWESLAEGEEDTRGLGPTFSPASSRSPGPTPFSPAPFSPGLASLLPSWALCRPAATHGNLGKSPWVSASFLGWPQTLLVYI